MIAIERPITYFMPVTYKNRFTFEHPYDANQGPAYGYKQGAAVAVIGAVSSIGTGLALMETSALLGGMMIAGGIASGLGAITGNKFLSTLGMGLSIAGGIGGAFMDVGGNFSTNILHGGSLSDTALGAAGTKAFDSFKNFIGMGSDGTQQLATLSPGNIDPATVAENTGTNNFSPLSGSDGQKLGVGVKLGATDNGLTVNGSLTGSGATASSGNGLLSKLGITGKDVWSGVGQVGDYLGKQDELKQAQPLIDSKINQTDAQTNQINQNTALQKAQYDNKQFQGNVGMFASVDPTWNQQTTGGTPNPGKMITAPDANNVVRTMSEADWTTYMANNPAFAQYIQQQKAKVQGAA